jgi:hypothetical protein
MRRPAIHENGENNWKEVDWDDPDIGEYTNLCPDKRRAEFEYGSMCIVKAASGVHVNEVFSPRDMSPSKIARELKQLIGAFDRLSPDTIQHLMVYAGFTDPTKVMKEYLDRALDRVEQGTQKPDRSRKKLGEDAWAIWEAHRGKLEGKGRGEGRDFEAYVDRLLINAGFATEDKKKNRVSVDNLVGSIRRASKTRAPQGWQLWEPEPPT